MLLDGYHRGEPGGTTLRGDRLPHLRTGNPIMNSARALISNPRRRSSS